MKTIHEKVKMCGGRLTKTKKAIIEALLECSCLLSKSDLVAKLETGGINPDQSTIYRELQFLTKNNIVIKSTIGGIDYYEIEKDHHHHLVCLKCNQIQKVEMEHHLAQQEKKIATENRFDIINHSLEFYGYCQKCKC
jgi:Fur family ferric uptake transcriptional regulator